jgi:tetratricopeptide (TPR) repeat protein
MRISIFVSILLLASAAHAGPDAPAKREASTHYKQGKAYFQAGAYDKAVAEFRAAYDIAPANPILFNIARSYQLAGDKKQAVDWYGKYLGAEPDGALADEARGYLAELVKALDADAADAEAKRKAADAERDKQQREAAERAKHEQAEAHVKQAKAYANAHDPLDAASELVAAFDADGDTEHLWAAAEAARIDRKRARELYQRYLDVAPAGPHADDARGKVASLAAQIADSERTVEIRTAPPQAKAKGHHLDWRWLAAGAALAAAGVITDVGPSSAHNGKLDGTDFIPLACYGLAGGAVFVGVW